MWDFLSDLKEPPETEAERLRLTSTLHALDHVSRLAKILPEAGAPYDPRAAALCTEAMRAAQTVGRSITSEAALSAQAGPIVWNASAEVAAALADGEVAARQLDALQRDHRAATLASVAPGGLTATDAFARVDAIRRLDRIAHHAWRSAAHLLGRGAQGADLV